MKRVALLLLFVVALSSGATPALAFEVSGTDSVRLQLRPTLKQSLGLPGLSLSRLRLDLEAEWSERWVWEMAYEHQVLSRFAGSTTGLALQASQSASPYRFNAPWRPVMEWGADLLWRHQVDRAVLAYHGDTFDIRVGRQAIGLGRGTLFGAVDVFAPFRRSALIGSGDLVWTPYISTGERAIPCRLILWCCSRGPAGWRRPGTSAWLYGGVRRVFTWGLSGW